MEAHLFRNFVYLTKIYIFECQILYVRTKKLKAIVGCFETLLQRIVHYTFNVNEIVYNILKRISIS